MIGKKTRITNSYFKMASFNIHDCEAIGYYLVTMHDSAIISVIIALFCALIFAGRQQYIII